MVRRVHDPDLPHSRDARVDELPSLEDVSAAPKPKRTGTGGLMKSISFFVPIEYWKLLRDHSAKTGVSYSDFCWPLIEPALARLREQAQEPEDA